MKTKKIYTFLVLFLIGVISNSCTQEYDLNGTSSLIGHWAEKPSVEQFNYVFNSDATGSFYIINCNTGAQTYDYSFKYQYDKNKKIVTETYTSGSSSGYVRTDSIRVVGGNEIYIQYEHYYRQ